ncbi:MAG: Heat Shock Protein [Alectoria sarmentosa]|nr:MAG: Heat Shock Protein [Alectoria sarmentosa]
MLSTLTLHTLQAPTTRHIQAVRTPILTAGGLSPVSSSRSAYAGIATFRNGIALRSTVASGPWPGKLGRKPLSVSSAAATDVQEETHEYQAELVHQSWELMLQISDAHKSNADLSSGVIQAGQSQLYACRELVSNGSDALDKMRFEGLTDRSAFETGEELEMRIKADSEKHTITIEDTGIGMTKEELLDSLGTIARSGTAKFAERVKETKGDAQLIGQFGVGFYSSFLVADKVTVQSKSNNSDKQWLWESASGSHSYKWDQVKEDDSGEPLKRGTRVTLHLKEDAYELADEKKVGELIKQYSEFIQFPIRLWTTKSEQEKVPDEEATKRKQESADAKAKEEGKEAADPVEPVTRTVSKSSEAWQVQNDSKPLWTRSPREVSKDEYDAFFKQTFKEFLEPLTTSHFNVEGTIEFTAMLFVPGMAPFEQQLPAMLQQLVASISLWRVGHLPDRVFISDEFDEDLMPRYLSFIKGIVDSSDLPLNVSREILQLVKRSLDMLTEIAKRPAEGDKKSDYSTFWESFGRNLKLGCIEDQGNRKVLAELLRFPSSKSEDDMTSLKDYVSRMKEGQKDVFYMAADSLDAASSAPFVERLVQRDYEVLYLTEPIDEVAIQNLAEYDDKKFVDVSREGIDLGADDQDTKKTEEQVEQLKSLTEYMAKVLGDKVEKVVVSQRLADSPCALVTSKFGYSANMERIMKTQVKSAAPQSNANSGAVWACK